jgi:nitrate reductase gamma subunit
MFHYGALAAIGGHVIGLMIPKSFTEAIGMSEHTYRWFSAIAGAVAGAVCIVGFFGLVYRRATNVRVRRTTSRTDLFVYFLLTVLIVMGCWMTIGYNLATKTPYDYRDSMSLWWRSLFILQPDVAAVEDANVLYQVHAIVAWAFWAVFPFSRLVHMLSIPLQYLGRPYILYRRRYAGRP